MDKFGKRLKEARNLKGWSIRELAVRANVCSQCVERYEKGQGMPTFYNAARLACALSVSLDWLAGRAKK